MVAAALALSLTTTTPAAQTRGEAPAPPPGRAVVCHVDYGGQTQRIVAEPVDSPYGVQGVEVGSYFLFRVVNQTRPADLASVKITTYAHHDSGPAPIHQAQYSPAQVRRRPTAAGHGFTGLQWVYEPVRDGELRYWCERAPGASGARHASQARPVAPPTGPGTGASTNTGPGASTGAATLRLLFGGDVMLDDGPGRTIAAGGDPLAPIAPLLAEADFRIANLEVPVATVGQPLQSKIYTFRAHPRVMRVLKGRFEALSVANNHAGDYGKAAFLQTLAHVRDAGIQPFGGGRNLTEAHTPLWIRRPGLTVAVLGYNEFKPRSFEAGSDTPGVAWSEDEQVVADIRAARRAGADVVIPFMHWGWEREPEPTARQRQLARRMIDAGADAVVGGHPHVTQGAELYKGKPIIYSLGNLVFDGFEDVPGGTTGWLLRLTLDAHGVRAWDTRVVHMDAAGTPHPAAGAASPCGVRQGFGRRARMTLGQCTAP